MTGNGGAVHAIAFAPDSGSLATGGADGAVRLWNVRGATPLNLGQIGRHARSVTCLSFTPDGRFVLAGSADGALDLWPATLAPATVSTGQQGRTLGNQGSALTCLAIAPDGRTAISGARRNKLGPGGALMLWDLSEGGPPRTLDAQRELVCAVGFTPDSSFALSCNLDETVMLWDVHRHGEPFRGTLGPGESFESSAFSPDGRRLISGGYQQEMRLWDYDGPARCNDLAPHAEAAVKTLQAAAGGSHADPAALVSLGEWYAFRGRPDWAVNFFARAAAGAPTPPR